MCDETPNTAARMTKTPPAVIEPKCLGDIIFNPTAYEPFNGWQDLERLRAHVDANSNLLPAKFNDLEDEDINDAVDDEECCFVLDMECIERKVVNFTIDMLMIMHCCWWRQDEGNYRCT